MNLKDERDLKSLSRGSSRDMSPEAIAQRLEIASQLRDLAQTLATARRIDEGASNAKVPGASSGDRDSK